MLRPRRFALVGLLAAGLLAAGFVAGCSEPDENPTEEEPAEAECERDEMGEPASAGELNLAEENTGYICPVEDQDWYHLDVPQTDKIFRVSLSMAAMLSPVEPTYTLWSTEGGEPKTSVASATSTQIGAAIDDVHCIEPGPHLLVVQDSGDDAEDNRNEYRLDVSTQPDPDTNEPNQEVGQATQLTAAQSVTGYIACGGDRDVYEIDVPEGNLMRLKLTSEVATYEPTLKLLDSGGNVLVEESNKSGSVKPTDIDRFEVLPGAGTYNILVHDDDDEDADPDVPYTLTVELISDADPNEPNNHPDEATELASSAQNCGGSWSAPLTTTGTIGSPGDDDWFVVPVSGCSGGIIEASVRIRDDNLSNAEKWTLAGEVQATITMVRPHADSPCQDDGQCTTLQQACSDDVDCAGVFDTCLSQQGLCSGSTVCLPEDQCGANVVQRHFSCNSRFDECDPSQTAPPNKAEFAAPLFNDDRVYLRVSDFQANGAAPDAIYSLDVRFRQDPDTYEPSNVFTNTIDPDFPVGAHQALATEVPVHDCTADDCCGSGTWINGYIAYENDRDFFSYVHPCPDSDCTMRMHYQVDGGEVDTVMNIRRGGPLWFSAYDMSEEEAQSSLSGTLGGTTASDTCFYAYQGHSGDPFRYYVEVRDLFDLYSDDKTVIPDTRDWSAGQQYSFCLEKVANSCSEPPCKVYENGCGQP